ncbi:MAG: HDIG domain-containing protein [Deltaproteobacteria bacterium]|nr:HDIG domain-containing protein [Deltaproteobacteria bacterium]MBW2306364.1 HDIG domain-containing protein [Deltaproteobacteria bacterium]
MFKRLAMLLSVSLLMGWLLSPTTPPSTREYRVGDIAWSDVRAPRDLLVEDTLSTQKRRLEKERSLGVIYDLDPKVLSHAEKTLKEAFTFMRELYPAPSTKSEGLSRRSITKEQPLLTEDLEKKITKRRELFQKKLGFPLSDYAFYSLKNHRFDERIEDYCYAMLAPVIIKGVVSRKELFRIERDSHITLLEVETGSEIVLRDPSSLLDLDSARRYIALKGRESLLHLSRSMRDTVIEISQKLVLPNITLNKSETEKRKKEALDSIKPVYFQLKKGEVILREGERVSPEHLLKLEALGRDEDHYTVYKALAGYTIMVMLLLFLLYYLASRNAQSFAPRNVDLLMFCMAILGTLMMVKAALFITESVNRSFPFIPTESLSYAVPFALAPIMIAMMLNAEAAMIIAIPISIFSAMMFDTPVGIFFYSLVGGLVGAHNVVFCSARSMLLKAGIRVGIINMASVMCLRLIAHKFPVFDNIYDFSFAFAGGGLAGILAAGMTPMVESLFGYMTNIKLLELTNLNHRAMRDLVLKAPGTYQHSVIVGSLSEAAAEAIGANPLLARVSAYYHDIGKINKPLYFIENQKSGENKHDKLAPSMSSLIITSHVKDGMELARKYRLGQPIKDIIHEHHGTSLISFFYNKAKNQENSHPVDEKSYRYPGPKPQTKEAAVVMLADAVEAASRTLVNPTPSRVQGAVQQLINSFMTDGQLNDCHLTIRDMHQIARSFTNVLNAIYHHRIDYPTSAIQVMQGKKKNGSADRGQAAVDSHRPRMGGTGGRVDIRRLGKS